jgi:hypothetical protein
VGDDAIEVRRIDSVEQLSTIIFKTGIEGYLRWISSKIHEQIVTVRTPVRTVHIASRA